MIIFAKKAVVSDRFSAKFNRFSTVFSGNSEIAMFRGFLLNDNPGFPTNPHDGQLNQGAFWTLSRSSKS